MSTLCFISTRGTWLINLKHHLSPDTRGPVIVYLFPLTHHDLSVDEYHEAYETCPSITFDALSLPGNMAQETNETQWTLYIHFIRNIAFWKSNNMRPEDPASDCRVYSLVLLWCTAALCKVTHHEYSFLICSFILHGAVLLSRHQDGGPKRTNLYNSSDDRTPPVQNSYLPFVKNVPKHWCSTLQLAYNIQRSQSIHWG